ncbi:S41 family peptidase [Neolewinella sp.]|uniref:S41 family peptidase n=1 Tax=Neolewinella sp. TaxID=2993543 RepID=UPI003B5207B5
MRNYLLLILLALVYACRTPSITPDVVEIRALGITYRPDTLQLSSTARDYIDTVVSHMREVALHRDRVDFDALRNAARYYSQGATTAADTYAGIERAMVLLDDHHSSLLTPEVLTDYLGLGKAQIDDIRAGQVPHLPSNQLAGLDERLTFATATYRDGIGYLRIPSFERIYYEEMQRFADSLQSSIRVLEAQGVRTWVVDLSGNDGGAELPMILGLGPLLDEQNGYYGIDARGRIRSHTFYRDGGYYNLDEGQRPATAKPLVTLPDPYVLKTPNLPILLLTSGKTASSAEAVVAIFKEQSNVLQLGEATNGLTSVNSFEVLPDNAVLNITVAYMADRTKQVHEQGIGVDGGLEELEGDLGRVVRGLMGK